MVVWMLGKKTQKFQMSFKFQFDAGNASVLLFTRTYSHHKDVMLSLNNGAPKYMKQNLIELKREKYNSTVIAGNFNTLLSIMDRFIRQKNESGNIGLKLYVRLDEPNRNKTIHPTASE